uniref:Uncharacterized protein n=1 Tax=Melopsittacus undulatus TaxID=13146 RepID=A0A8V5HH38_MELUD
MPLPFASSLIRAPCFSSSQGSFPPSPSQQSLCSNCHTLRKRRVSVIPVLLGSIPFFPCSMYVTFCPPHQALRDNPAVPMLVLGALIKEGGKERAARNVPQQSSGGVSCLRGFPLCLHHHRAAALPPHCCCLPAAEPCSLPLDEGGCRRYTLRWYHSQSGAECRPFVYSGCGGNSNRFDSREECELRCGAGTAGTERHSTGTGTALAPAQRWHRQRPRRVPRAQPVQSCGDDAGHKHWLQCSGSLSAGARGDAGGKARADQHWGTPEDGQC